MAFLRVVPVWTCFLAGAFGLQIVACPAEAQSVRPSGSKKIEHPRLALGGPGLGEEAKAGITAAAPPAASPTPVEPPVPETVQPKTPLADAIKDALAASGKLIDERTQPHSAWQAARDADVAAARAFYESRAFEPQWTVTGAGWTPRASQLVAELQRAREYGLDPAEFEVPAITGDAADSALAVAELRLTGAVLKYARFARGGRIADPEAMLSGYLDRRPSLVPPGELLTTLALSEQPASVLSALHPRHPQFELLRQAYLKAITDRPEPEIKVPANGPLIVPGKSHADIVKIRQRLKVEPAQGMADTVYDPALVAAVKAFQASNGLRADGMIGERTRGLLNGANASAKAGPERLLANMEMWRWMPSTLGDTRVEVNIPEQQVRFYRSGRIVHAERVVVGKQVTATPVFSNEIRTVVFKPKWGVPDSIKLKELLPALQAGNGLRRGLRMSLNGREVDPWDIDWQRADITKYLVFQPSGDDNALGQVKFLFPNRHAVYLHDTPSKGLFNASTRLFSHGCVRVRNPVRLAELLLESDKNWSTQRVRDLLDDGPEDNPVKLDAGIPVHLVYFTASVDEAGNVIPAADVYGHEKRVTQALQGKFDDIDKLDPPVIERPQLEASAKAPAGNRVRVNGRYVQPAGVGRVQPQESAPQWKLFEPVQKPAAAPKVRGGQSSGEMILRSLGGLN